MNKHGNLRKNGFVGFAHRYLQEFYKEQFNIGSKTDDEIDIHIYTKLVELDSKLGTSAVEQLFECVKTSLRLNLIKVPIQLRVLQLKLF